MQKISSLIATSAHMQGAPVHNIIRLTAAKLTCPCNMIKISNLFAGSDTVVVIDGASHLFRTCKTSLLFASLAVRIHIGCSAFPLYTPTKLLILLHIKYKTVLFPKL